MSQHVRRYGKYISEKIYTYRLCAFDFCKVKRGREDGLLRTMNTDKVRSQYFSCLLIFLYFLLLSFPQIEKYRLFQLLKTLPILQNQIDALLEFQVRFLSFLLFLAFFFFFWYSVVCKDIRHWINVFLLQVTSAELNNGVINCSFILLFRDLIRLFACYNDGVINLLEKYFDMNKKQCREALDAYKSFLVNPLFLNNVVIICLFC